MQEWWHQGRRVKAATLTAEDQWISDVAVAYRPASIVSLAQTAWLTFQKKLTSGTAARQMRVRCAEASRVIDVLDQQIGWAVECRPERGRSRCPAFLSCRIA
jgi:hypothetical protein